MELGAHLPLIDLGAGLLSLAKLERRQRLDEAIPPIWVGSRGSPAGLRRVARPMLDRSVELGAPL